MQRESFIDTFHTKFQLVSQNTRGVYNWLFVPGGPGMGADYLRSLASDLNLPGSVWLMDLPANGDNFADDIKPDYNFNQWDDMFIPAIRQFEHPIIVGHSFGGMYPFLFPELEEVLSGMVILNSSPKLWMEASARVVEERQLPSIESGMIAMMQNPCEETGMAALLDCVPYYFSQHGLEAGRALISATKFNCHAALWWFQRVGAVGYAAQWVPQQVNTLIIGGGDDAMTPFTLFENDERFARENIHLHLVKDGGHFPWIEQPQEVKEQFLRFVERLG